MKTEEDEAFDDLARRQGMWGGGFHAKRAAAADKQEPAQSMKVEGPHHVVCQCDKCKAQLAQPAQEPVAWMWKDMRGQDVVSLFEPRLNSIPLYIIPPMPAQKTTAIHQFRSPHSVNWYDGFPDHHDGSGPYEVRTLYITPPKREWVGLTDEETQAYWDWEDWQTGAGRSTIFEMVRDIEAKLKEKNT